MKVTPKPAIASRLTGPVGNLVFQRQPSGHIVRRPWVISVPPSGPQVIHRQAFIDSYDLWSSIPDNIRARWDLYAAPLDHSPLCAWGSFNILPLKAATVTAIAPPNPAWHRMWVPTAAPGEEGEIDVTWTYSGAPTTGTVAVFFRELPAVAWVLFDSYDADAGAATITALESASDYEVALVCHLNDHSEYDTPAHFITHPGRPLVSTSYYPNSLGCGACSWTHADPLGAAVVFPRGHTYTDAELLTISTSDNNTVDVQNQPPPPWDQAIHTVRFHIEEDWEDVEAIHLIARFYLGSGENFTIAAYDWAASGHFDFMADKSSPPSAGYYELPVIYDVPARDGPPFYVLSPGYLLWRFYNTSSWDQWTKLAWLKLLIYYYE